MEISTHLAELRAERTAVSTERDQIAAERSELSRERTRIAEQDALLARQNEELARQRAEIEVLSNQFLEQSSWMRDKVNSPPVIPSLASSSDSYLPRFASSFIPHLQLHILLPCSAVLTRADLPPIHITFRRQD